MTRSAETGIDWEVDFFDGILILAQFVAHHLDFCLLKSRKLQFFRAFQFGAKAGRLEVGQKGRRESRPFQMLDGHGRGKGGEANLLNIGVAASIEWNSIMLPEGHGMLPRRMLICVAANRLECKVCAESARNCEGQGGQRVSDGIRSRMFR